MREQKIASKSISLLWLVSLGKPESRGRAQGCETRADPGCANQELQEIQCWCFLLMHWKEVHHECPSGSQQHKSGGYVLKPSFQQFGILDVIVSVLISKELILVLSVSQITHKKKSPEDRSWLSSMSWMNSSFLTAGTELLTLEGPLDIL